MNILDEAFNINYRCMVIEFAETLENSSGEILTALLKNQKNIDVTYFNEPFNKNFLSLEGRTFFDFIDKYLPTYKIILVKIWNSKLTNDFYFICDLDLNKDSIYLMNDFNVSLYESSGYICDIPKNFIRYFNMDAMDVINFPLPSNLAFKYEIKTNNYDKSKVNLKAIYTTQDDITFKSILPIVYINKNKNV